MFRRLVSLLVLAAYTVSYLAVVPHAHASAADGEQQRLESAPHIHLEWFTGGHSHSPASTEPHTHEAQTCSHAAPPAGTEPNEHGRVDSPHGADAVFVPHANIASSRELKPIDAAQLSAAWHDGSTTAIVLAQNPSLQFWMWRPPDKVQDDSELYLSLRTLRI